MSRLSSTIRSILLRRSVLALVLLSILVVAVAPIQAQSGPVPIRIGYQRNGVWPLLKAQGTLEKLFGDKATVTWSVFPAGPQLLEALNAGAIDIGYTGETPPVFAQAAGTPLVYIASVASDGSGQAVLVPANSPIKTLADLKGKKVAFNKASSAHLMLVLALQKAGLQYSDIVPEFLAPPDARAAFEGGSIDAWVIWDPFRAAAIKELGARSVVEGQNVSPTIGYAEASKDFVAAHPDLVKPIVEAARDGQAWTRDHKDEYSQILAKETGLDASIIKATLNDVEDYRWIDDVAIAHQQEVADIFYNLQLIPDKLNIKDVVWIGGTNPPPATAQATEAATAAQ